MVQLLTGGKGEGKTKRLIDMANNALQASEGHIVFVDDDKRHIYDLHYKIRFIETEEFPIENHKMFIGFIFGILSQDRDIEKIFVDGVSNIIKDISMEEFEALIKSLDAISKRSNVDFILTMNKKVSELPEALQQYVA